MKEHSRFGFRSFAPLMLALFGVGANAQTALKITAPSDGTVVHSGGKLVVIATAEKPPFPQLLMLSIDSATYWGDFADYITKGPGPTYRFEVLIPSRAQLGICSVRVASQEVASPEIAIDVERPDKPTRLRPNLQYVALDVGERYTLLTWGYFSDGAEVNITRSTLTSWTSNNPGVVSVTKEGQVTGHRPGRATVIVKNGSAETAIAVVVEPK
jgi:hypothetical protein